MRRLRAEAAALGREHASLGAQHASLVLEKARQVCMCSSTGSVYIARWHPTRPLGRISESILWTACLKGMPYGDTRNENGA